MPTIFASTPKWPSVSTSLRPTASWSRGSGPLSPLPRLQRLRGRRPVVDLLRGGDAALLAHRGQRDACSATDVGPRRSSPRPRSEVSISCQLRVEVLGDRARRSGRRRAPRPGRRSARTRRPRDRCSSRRSARPRVSKPSGLRLTPVVAGSGSTVCATPRPPRKTPAQTPRPSPRKQRRDRGPGDAAPRRPASIKTVKIRAPTVAEQIGERRFRPRSRPCPPPSRRRGRRRVDAGGDQEEPDQVEVALLEPGRADAGRTAACAALRACLLPALAAARGRTALLAHEHARLRFDAPGASPAHDAHRASGG